VSEIAALSVGVGGQVINLADVTNIYRTREADPDLVIRHNGQEAFTVGVAGIATENIVDIGKRVDDKLAQLRETLPLGISVESIYRQHTVVEEASNAFLLNLAMSVGIVVAVLAVFMGWRAAIVVGSTLLLTVVGTLFFMALGAIEMERISLGALIIAMGMLVDNAIVVAEGMQISMQQGKSSRDAATEAASKTQIPLLGATVIGIMAFAGIGLSPDATGEFLFSLFAVIAISLLLSWLLAITATPLLGHYFFKRGAEGGAGGYDGAIFKGYAAVLRASLKLRWLVIVALIAGTAVCYALFGQIKQQFFPDSNTPLIYVHSKVSIFDEAEAIVSSANLNGRSMRWDTEAGLHVTRSDQVAELRARVMGCWLPKEADASFLDIETAFGAWQDMVGGNSVLPPRHRAGFLVDYDSDVAKAIAMPLPGMPEEVV